MKNYFELLEIPPFTEEEKLLLNSMKYPNIMIGGETGTGKSASIRNLDPKRTIVVNVERKPLSFKGALKFKHNMDIYHLAATQIVQIDGEQYYGYDKIMDKARRSNELDNIFVDSFTELSNLIKIDVKTRYTGWDVYESNAMLNKFDTYNYMIPDAIRIGSGSKGKLVVFTGQPELLKDETGIVLQRIAVDGKKLEGKIESYFTICLWTQVDSSEKGNRYSFVTNHLRTRKGILPAKTPDGMLPHIIPNDLALVKLAIECYYLERPIKDKITEKLEELYAY